MGAAFALLTTGRPHGTDHMGVNRMENDEAARLIREITYKPGWAFRAMDHPRIDGTVELQVSYPVPNSDAQYAPDYAEPVRPTPVLGFYLYVSKCQTPIDLYGLVFECLLEIERHEAREFFAVDRRFTKPFHPHTIDGIDNWRTRAGIDELQDFSFGIITRA